MAFDIEDHIYIILNSRRDKDLAYQLWLEGFNELFKQKQFNGITLSEQILGLQYNYDKLSYYYDPFFNAKHSPLIKQQQILGGFLPLNDEYHLLTVFKIADASTGSLEIFRDNFYINKYSSNNITAPYPVINLRLNQVLSNEDYANISAAKISGSPAKPIMKNGLEHDAYDSFKTNIDFDMMKKSYDLVDYLIKHTSI